MFITGVPLTTENETKQQRFAFFGMFWGSLLGKTVAGDGDLKGKRGVVRAGEGATRQARGDLLIAGNGVLRRAGQEF